MWNCRTFGWKQLNSRGARERRERGGHQDEDQHRGSDHQVGPSGHPHHQSANLCWTFRWTKCSQKDPRTTSWVDSIPARWLNWTSGTQSIFPTSEHWKALQCSMQADQLGVVVWTDELANQHQDGVDTQCAQQRLLPVLQVGAFYIPSARTSIRSMFRHVVAAMTEAQDISVHLRPLKSHIQVDFENTLSVF